MSGKLPARIPISDATSRDRIINRVVVATTSGKRLPGFVYDLSTADDAFHIFNTEDASDSRSEILTLAECKAIYFVRSHTGNPHYRENKTNLAAKKRFGRPFRVTFGDGEVIVGTVEVYHPDRKGFYLIPPDPKSNNLRIFVVAANAREVLPLAPEGTGTGHGEWSPPDPVKYAPEKRVEVVIRLLRGTDIQKLSLEVFLSPRVMQHWKDRFLRGGAAALTNGALAAARTAEDPARSGEKLDRYGPGERLDMVLRLYQNEDQAVVSQVFLVPFRTLAEWRERFLDGATDEIHLQFDEESRRPAEEVSLFYESLPDPDARAGDSGMGDFLDGLSKSVGA